MKRLNRAKSFIQNLKWRITASINLRIHTHTIQPTIFNKFPNKYNDKHIRDLIKLL